MKRQDHRRPANDRAGLPSKQYPTPNIEDFVIVEDIPVAVSNFVPLARGTPHPHVPAATLVDEAPRVGDNNERQVRRIWATDRAAQDAYNASIKFVSESATHPVYIRSYVLKRPVTRGTRNAPLTSLIGITLGSGGSGYAAAPAVSFSGGGGSGAEAVAVVQNGVVVALWLTDGGTGYTSAPAVSFAPAGDVAIATVVLAEDSGVASVNVISNGSGYSLGVIAMAIGGGGSGATFEVNLTGDAISGITVLSPGAGYTEPPLIAISGGGGAGALAEATLSGASIASVIVDDEGGEYTSAPTVTITGDGSGATATATLTGDHVSSITVTAPGSGYTSATVFFSGGRAGSGATATALIQETSAVLTHEEINPAPGDIGSIFDQVLRVYSTQPGPQIKETTSSKGGTFIQTVRQAVAPGTLPSAPAGVVLEDVVRQSSTTEAERVTRTVVDSSGVTASGFPIWQTERRDEHGNKIITDHFLAPKSYALPATFVGGSAINIAGSYPTWKQPNANNIGYSANEYTPVRYVIGARKESAGETSDNVVVEIDHSQIPATRIDDSKQIGYTFPGVFTFNDEPYEVPNDYDGNYPPPWPIGDQEVGGFKKIAHRSGTFPTRRIFIYGLGRQENLPPVYRVITPGTASRKFSIPERTIHNAFVFHETLTNGDIQVIEDIPASTPSTYDSKDILVADAVERRWAGEIYETEITLISEDTPVRDFPDPTTNGYAVARRSFVITPQVGFTAATATINGRAQAVMNGRELVVSTTDGASVTATFFGRTRGSDGPVAVRESVSATGTPAATLNTWLSLREVMLSAPLSVGSVIIQRAVDPSTASLEVSATPADGDIMSVGLSPSAPIYQYRTALASDAFTSAIVSVGGSGFLQVPSVIIAAPGGGGTQAYGAAAISGGAVVSITSVYPGTGYDPNSPPTITFGPGGTGATATASVSNAGFSDSVVTTIAVTAGGNRYSSPPTVTLSGVAGEGAQAIASVSGGAVTAVAIRTATFTANAATDVVTAAAHGLSNTHGIRLTTSGTLPAPLATGTTYFIRDATTDTFKLAATSGGSVIDITTAGTGTHAINYCGSGYTSAPTVGFSGGFGSGATVTAVITQQRQIKISSNPKTMAARIAQAINGTALGSNVGAGTTAHADLKAGRSAAEPSTVEFSSTSATSAPGSASWTLGVTTGTPFVDQHAATWCAVSSFVAGGDQETICTITAGVGQAFVRTILTGNPQLYDETKNNDAQATPNLPAAPVLYTDWWHAPSAALTIKFSVAGAPALRMAYQTASTAAEPATLTASVTVTNGFATISSGTDLTPYIGCKIVIPGDTVENELTGTTTLMRAFLGSTGSVIATITPLVATLLGKAMNGTPHSVHIGTVSGFIRLKITQPSTPYKFRAAQVDAGWSIVP